jgi:gliding motility-associated-like protein
MVKNLNNCELAGSKLIITQPDPITFSSQEVTGAPRCYGMADGSITIVLSDTASGYKYSIDNGLNYFENDGLFTNITAGNYQVRVKNNNNCEQGGNNLIINQPTPVKIDSAALTNANGDKNGSIKLAAEGGISPYTFVVRGAVGDSVKNNSGEFTDIVPGDYSANAIDNNQCYSETLDFKVIQTSVKIIIYDAFSPNGDGKNDVWNIFNIELYPDCKVTIFNTWGSKVFSSNGYTVPWDGKYKNKYLPAGTYYYIIDLGDGSEVYTGPVSIVR